MVWVWGFGDFLVRVGDCLSGLVLRGFGIILFCGYLVCIGICGYLRLCLGFGFWWVWWMVFRVLGGVGVWLMCFAVLFLCCVFGTAGWAASWWFGFGSCFLLCLCVMIVVGCCFELGVAWVSMVVFAFWCCWLLVLTVVSG